jgi:pyruvate/2-oxoglutarate dehydrogenase complex dihydrolipoamide dehydrogenase (E3) component
MDGVEFSSLGTTEVDGVTYATGREGVFAGGDVQTGPWVAIGAIAAGKEAAESILRYLDGRDMAAGREPHPARRTRLPAHSQRMLNRGISRAKMPELPVEKRGRQFQ